MDGLVLWWDMRFPKKPIEKLVMDLDDPGKCVQSDRHHLPSIRTNDEQQILGRHRERYRCECEQEDRQSGGEIVGQIRVLRGPRASHRSKSRLLEELFDGWQLVR